MVDRRQGRGWILSIYPARVGSFPWNGLVAHMGCQQELAGQAVPWSWPLWFIHFLTVGKSTWLIWKQECCAFVAPSLCAAPSPVPLSSAVFPGCGCGAELQRDALGGPAARPTAAAWPGPDHQGELGQPWGLPKNPPGVSVPSGENHGLVAGSTMGSGPDSQQTLLM